MNDYEKLVSRVPSQQYKDNWDLIWGKKKEESSESHDEIDQLVYGVIKDGSTAIDVE